MSTVHRLEDRFKTQEMCCCVDTETFKGQGLKFLTVRRLNCESTA